MNNRFKGGGREAGGEEKGKTGGGGWKERKGMVGRRRKECQGEREGGGKEVRGGRIDEWVRTGRRKRGFMERGKDGGWMTPIYKKRKASKQSCSKECMN